MELQKKYKLIGPLITKVEGLVFNTNTSQAPQMKLYYAYWEREIFSTLSQVTTPYRRALIRKIDLRPIADHGESEGAARYAGEYD